MATERTTGTARVKRGLAEMLRGGVIMDVVTPEQAKIAEDAGASAVMALERVPSDIRRDGGVARMSDPSMIEGIQKAVTIPVMAKCRIGHFAEAQVLQSLGVDYVDESEVLTPADEAYHVDKWAFTVPFVCGATNLGEALRRIGEGAALIRSKGEAGTGNIVEAVRHLRSILGDIEHDLDRPAPRSSTGWAKELRAPLDLVQEVAERGELPVPLFCAGGIATPADAALVMQLGAQSVFVGSGIFKSSDPAKRARAIVEATTHYADADIVAKVSRGLGEAMPRRGDRHARREARRARLVTRHRCRRRARPPGHRRSAVLALQGAFREQAEALDALGADVDARQDARAARGGRRDRAPGRRVDHGRQAARLVGLAHAAARRAPRRHARAGGVRGADRACGGGRRSNTWFSCTWWARVALRCNGIVDGGSPDVSAQEVMRRPG